MRYIYTVPATADVEYNEVADAFAETSSVEQTILLEELFDSLRHKCKDHFHLEKQLLHIADEIKKRNLKNLKYVIETLNEFLKESK